MMKRLFQAVFFILVFTTIFYACKKDEFLTDPNASLNFSADTIIFDTVFTTVGSSTEFLVVYNNNDQPVNISSLKLATGNSSNFRLNVDGVAGKSFTNVEIGANDSIFIFVEVTVDPNNGTTPLIVNDSIVFETNGNIQDVDLVAWGQDAYFHKPAAGTALLFFVDCNSTWTNDKPHVVYGYALVDSGCTLTIQDGARVYFHPNSGMIVLSSGTLKVMGTATNPVTIQGDRLGVDFENVAGQWNYIRFSNISAYSNNISPGSRNSEINYAIIKNGNVGLIVDTVYQPNDTTLKLNNVIIQNMSGTALLAQGSNIEANNCVFANCGQSAVQLLYGGNYRFTHCTMANYWEEGTRDQPVLALNNYFEGQNSFIYVRQFNAQFYNCIIDGNLENEVVIDSVNSGIEPLNYKFDHALMKLENAFSTSDPNHFNVIIRGSSANPKFKDVENNNYLLDSTSICIDAGDLNFLNLDPVLFFDLNNNPRPAGPMPDLGAYEIK